MSKDLNKLLTPDEYEKVKEFCDWAAPRVANADPGSNLAEVLVVAMNGLIAYDAARVDAILESGINYSDIPSIEAAPERVRGATFKNAGKSNMPDKNVPDFNQPIKVSLDGIHLADLYFDWGQPTVGFGQVSISKNNDDGSVDMVSEGMSKSWVKRALYAAIDELVDNAKEVG